jgi:phage terminase large subunit-like protein
MTSVLEERRGAQRPSLCHLPPAKFASSGSEVVELAASAGLILDDWQCWVLEEALAERNDGQWAAFEVAVIVARQNGKGSILEALELAALFIFGMRLIVHSAHEFKTAREHFFRMQALILGAPELAEQVDYIHTANGAESIKLRSGARLNFLARSGGSGRGFSGDLIVMDEAFKLPAEAIGAMLPALSAMPNPQVWYTSSAPHVDSHVLHGLINRARGGEAGRLFLAGWLNDAEVSPDDWEAIGRGNPAWPYRISTEHIEAEREAMRHLGDEFARERLGVPSAEDAGAGVFGPGKWQACTDEKSEMHGPPVIALDVAEGMAFSSFGSAGLRADGLVHVEMIARAPGTGWVVERARELTSKWGVSLLVDPRSATGGLLNDLREAGVPVDEISDGALAKACATVQEKVQNGTLRHLGQRPLDDAVAGAAIRPSGDAWRWSRASSAADISPLVAVTIAAGKALNGVPQYFNLAEV